MEDHDQRFKVLLKEFLPEFLDQFLPALAPKLDFSTVEWLFQEAYFDPPQGEKRAIDLVAKVGTKEPVDPLRPGEPAACLALVHIEVESRDSAAPVRPRMFDYYFTLRRDYNMPVLPIALFLRVGLDGVGWDVYEEVLWGKTILRFEYAYVGLPALDGVPHLQGPNLLGVALAALMRLPAEKRAELKAAAMRRFELAPIHGAKRYYLAECLEAYFPLSDTEAGEYQRLIAAEPYRGVQTMATGWIEQGRELRSREILRQLVEKRFGPLRESALQHLEAMTAARVNELIPEVMDAKSLGELGLED